MSQKKRILLELYSRLFEAFGPRYWWPGDSGFEVAVGAILTQNTAWRNVTKAIKNLKIWHL
jgi:endonuclease-3 related protein